MNKKSPPFQDRLSGYRRAGSVSTVTVVSAAASWTLMTAPDAEAVVIAFNFTKLGPVAVSFSRFDFIGSSAVPSPPGPDGSRFQLGFSTLFAAGTGSDFVSGAVPMSFPIGSAPGNAYPIAASNPGIAVGAIHPLRVTSGVNNFFGWIRRDTGGAGNDGTYTVGFSDQANTGILAGVSAVPEPSTALPLLLMGATGVALHRRRKQAAA